MVFIDSGKRFQCPFCEDITPVPQEYFNHLDHMGRRVDTYERAELCCGSYEFVATKDYCREQTLPMPPAFIFMIDVSVNSVRSGLLHVLCPYIKNVILPNLPKDSHNSTELSPIRVGFVTYDKDLHFYNLKSSLLSPQMMIVSDVDEVFVPILDGFLVNVHESRAVIDSLLDTLPSMFQENKETDLLLGPVIEAGVEALRAAKCAGKLFIFHTNLPNALAPGQLKMRDDKKLLGTDKEKQVLQPQNDYYAGIGKKCVEQGCSVDFFLMPNQYCDVATLCDVTRKTGGQIYKYDFFMADSHGERLCTDLRYAISSTVAFDAVMKVRTSTGIKPVDYLGNFSMCVNDIELAGMTKQHSLSVELKHEDKLNENGKCFIQVALLYTSIGGQRRIRLHNLSLGVCTQYSQMFASCELDTLINYMAKLACRSVLVSTPKSIRENLIQQVANILAAYRKNCTNAPSKGQFILPETLKLLPVFSNSLLKSDPISGGDLLYNAIN
jgi:protein transport protein SEC24